MRSGILEIAALVFIGSVSRLVPHLPNMTAISAVALRSRARFGTAGLAIPVASLAISDVVIGLYDWRLLVSVYASFALVGVLGALLRNTRAVRTTVVAAAGSVLFFFTTNTVVWATSAWYPHTPAGLFACLTAGLPFLAYMLAGDVAFANALFSKTLPAMARRARALVTPVVSGMIAVWLLIQEAATAAPSDTRLN